jgi:hypothetical protein
MGVSAYVEGVRVAHGDGARAANGAEFAFLKNAGKPEALYIGCSWRADVGCPTQGNSSALLRWRGLSGAILRAAEERRPPLVEWAKRGNTIYLSRDARVNPALLLAPSLGQALMPLSGETNVDEGQQFL